MATLTIDPTDPQAPEFTEEEQDSLRVGEELYQAEEALLAGKFRDAEELEQAYIELQKKLGSRDNTPANEVDTTEAPVEEEEVIEEEPTGNFLENLWQEAHGEYSQETLDQLKEMRAVDVAQMYLEFRQQVESKTTEPEVVSESQVTAIRESIGGEKVYDEMITWAANNLNEQEVQMYDTVMERGDPLAMYFAVQALNGRYRDNTGFDGRLVTGKAPVQKEDLYRSQAEVVRAMSDSRYDNDPAYRQDVFDKLERSNINF